MRVSPRLFRNNIVPCSKYYCICIEYLNLRNEEHLKRYKYCYRTKSKDNFEYNLKKWEKVVLEKCISKNIIFRI